MNAISDMHVDVINIDEIVPGIFRIKIPVHTPLRDVNCYLARGRDGWTIVDTGFYSDTTKAMWRAAFRQLKIAPEDLTRIIVTHYHGDHYGSSGWLQEISGAPVIMHEPEIALLSRFWEPDYSDKIRTFFAQYGMPANIIGDLTVERSQIRHRTYHPQRIDTVKEGETILVGDRRFEVIWTPGHTDGLMILYNHEERLLFSNDMILDPISPNISVWPDTNPNPLKLYLTSLAKVARIPARITLTGHRDVVTDLAERCRQLELHHEERLAETYAWATQFSSAWDVALRLFGHAMSVVSNTRFALTETVAHLEYLCYQGKLRRVRNSDGTINYFPVHGGVGRSGVASR